MAPLNAENRLSHAVPLSDRDRLESLASAIAQLVPESPNCGLSIKSLLKLQWLARSHLDGSRVAAENR